MNTPTAEQPPVSPLSAHSHKTDEMNIQFVSSELQEKLMHTLHLARMGALGIVPNYGDDDDEDSGLRSVAIEDPEAIEKFAEALAAAGMDIEEPGEHNIEDLNINLADIGVDLDLDDMDPAIGAPLMWRDNFSKADQADALLDRLWPVPGRLATTERTDVVVNELYQECELLQAEIILNAIEEIPEEDPSTIRSILIALTMEWGIKDPEPGSAYGTEFITDQPGAEASRSQDQQLRSETINERIRRQVERADAKGFADEPTEGNLKRSIIYGTTSFLRAAAECARRMQQRLREGDGKLNPGTRLAIQKVLFDIAVSTQPMTRESVIAAEGDEHEHIIRRGRASEAQVREIYEAEFRQFNEELPITIMPGLAKVSTDRTRELAERVPVDIAGATLAVINEQDIAGFRKLHPEQMKLADNYRKLYPISKVEITNTVVAYHHEGRKYVQLPHEPYPRGYPAQRAWSDATAIAILAEHPNPANNEGLRADAVTVAKAADENVHDIDSEHMQDLVATCRASGMSDVAVQDLIEHMVMFDVQLTERLTKLTDLNPATPSRRQIRKIVSACRNIGVDEHHIANMIEAIGWTNMKSAGVKLHQTTRKDQRLIKRAVQAAYSDKSSGEIAAELVAETIMEWSE